MVLRFPTSWTLAVLLGPALLVRPIQAGDLPPEFTLMKYIPANAWMAMNYRSTEEGEWVYDRWAEVWSEVKRSGIDRDVLSLVLEIAGDENRAELKPKLDRFVELLGAVRWDDLAGLEIALGERLVRTKPGYEYMVYLRGTPGSVEHNFQALGAVLREIAAQDDDLALVPVKTKTAAGWRMDIADEGSPSPISFGLLRSRDLIVVVVGRAAMDDVAALLDENNRTAPRLTESPRFRAALEQVPRPQDGVMFFDTQAFFGQLVGMFKAIVEDEVDSADKVAKVGRAVEGAFERVSVFDYTISSISTVDRRQVMHTATRIKPESKDRLLARALYDRKPFVKYDKYIPADASGFWVTTGVDWGLLYRLVLDFVKEEIPDGGELIEKWNHQLANFGLDPQADLFDWLSGEMVQVSMPCVCPNSQLDGESVLMLRVSKPDVARAKVDQGLDWVVRQVQQFGQPLMIAPCPAVEAAGFREIQHPLTMNYVRPVIGVVDEWLVVGTSAAVVNKCLAVAAGDLPSIHANLRYRREGLVPEGPVYSVSFSDLRNFGKDAAAMVTAITSAVAVAPAMLPVAGGGEDAKEARRIASAMQKAIAMTAKIGPVLQTIDFLSSESAVSTFDGEFDRQMKVTTYRDPDDGGERPPLRSVHSPAR